MDLVLSKGPLALLSLALFGNESFIDNRAHDVMGFLHRTIAMDQVCYQYTMLALIMGRLKRTAQVVESIATDSLPRYPASYSTVCYSQISRSRQLHLQVSHYELHPVLGLYIGYLRNFNVINATDQADIT